MSGQADVLRDLTRAKAVFQQRAILAHMGVHPDGFSPATGTVISRSTSGTGGHSTARASVSGEAA